METARVLRCPSCGGTVDEEARHCGYCRAPVATVRCGYCYHMNRPDAVHCSGCGHVLGLEPAGAPDYLRCPACQLDLELFHGGAGTLRDCGRCGGQFIEHALLRELITRRELYGMAAPRRVKKSNPLSAPVRYVPCPHCNAMMNRKNFGGASGVIVDVCHAHGIWFDQGELPRVLAFVEAGGLAAARRREMEELERSRREARSQAPIVVPADQGSFDVNAVDLIEGAAEVASLLLGKVASLLTK